MDMCKELCTRVSGQAWGGGSSPGCAVRRTLELTVGLNLGTAFYYLWGLEKVT